MNALNAEVHAGVQQLVMEHGEYSPLELLLADEPARLRGAIGTWREGRLASLDSILVDGPRETRTWLEAARSWAETLGLDGERVLYHGWEENVGAVLTASADPQLDALLCTRFRHIRGHDQLDLFIDSAQTAAVNALLDALASRDAGTADRALDGLSRSIAIMGSGSMPSR